MDTTPTTITRLADFAPLLTSILAVIGGELVLTPDEQRALAAVLAVFEGAALRTRPPYGSD